MTKHFKNAAIEASGRKSPEERALTRIFNQIDRKNEETEGLLPIQISALHEKNAEANQALIKRGLAFVAAIRSQRYLNDENLADSSPVTSAELLMETATRDSALKPDKVTIMATMIARYLRTTKMSESAPVDPAESETINRFLQRIGGREGGEGQDKIRSVFQGKGNSLEDKLEKEFGDAVEKRVRRILAISEIYFGEANTKDNFHKIAREEFVEPQPEETRARAGVHMVMEIVGDPKNPAQYDPYALWSRLNQWIEDGRQLEKSIKQYPTSANQQKTERYAWMTEHFYEPLASAYGLKGSLKKLKDQRHRVVDPDDYEETHSKIMKSAKGIANEKLQHLVQDDQTVQGIVLKNLRADILGIFPPDKYGYAPDDLEMRKKETASAIETGKKKKTEGKSKDAIEKDRDKDYIAMRFIVSSEVDDDAHIEEKWAKERKPVGRLSGAICEEATSGKGIFSFVPEYLVSPEEKERLSTHPRLRPYEKDFYAEPKANGYRAHHFVLLINGVKVEVQVVGRHTHHYNTHEDAAHDGVYKDSHLPKEPDPDAPHTVSVFGFGRRVIEMPDPGLRRDGRKGPSVADYAVLTMGVPGCLAVSGNHVVISRTNIYGPDGPPKAVKNLPQKGSEPPQPDKLTIPLISTDEVVTFSLNPRLLQSAEHALRFADACILGTNTSLLKEYGKKLAREQAQKIPDRKSVRDPKVGVSDDEFAL